MDKNDYLHSLDCMSEAIALSSPSGKMSKRARLAAERRLAKMIFGETGGIPKLFPKQPTQAQENLRRAKELRDLAARGMQPRAYIREAEKLEKEAEKLSRLVSETK